MPERGSDDDSDTDFLTTDKLVAETFYNLFPDAFSEIMPIRNHKVCVRQHGVAVMRCQQGSRLAPG